MSLNLLDVVQQSARKGTLLASCEPEVKELMHQIDLLLSSQQNESKSLVQTLKSQLQQREREMSSLRVAVQDKNAQVDKMKEDVKRLEQQLKVRSSDHETQLLRLKSELNRLNKSYEKLKLRRGLSEEKALEMTTMKEELEGMRAHCEAQQSQITHLSQQVGLSRTREATLQDQKKGLEKELRDCQDELSHCNAKLTGDEKKFKENLTWTESQLKLCQDSIKSRDRKIQSLRTERDEIKKKHRVVIDDYQRLQEASVALSNENQGYQVGVADLELQLTREQSNLQTCETEKTHLQQQLSVSQELIKNKEKLIQSLDSRYKQKIESEVGVLSSQMKDLLEKMEVLKKEGSFLREENMKLRERVKKRHSTGSSSSSTPSPAMAEIQGYKAKLAERDQLVMSLEHKVHHLEEQLSEATSMLSSSSITTNGSLEGAEEGPSNPANESQNTTISLQSLKRETSFIEDVSSVNSTSQTSVGETSPNSLRRVSEHFQLALRGMPTDTPTDQSSSLLNMFKNSLDSILTDHFDKIDQSLRSALEQ